MEKKSDIGKYLADYLSGNIAEKDIKIIHAWAKESTENQKLLDLLSLNDDMKGRFLDYHQLKSPIYWRRMQSKLQRTRRLETFKKISRVAAAIILPLAIAFGVYMIEIPSTPAHTEMISQIQPGTQKATLLLSDNIKIALDTVIIGKLELAGISTIFKEEKGKLSYKVKPTDLAVKPMDEYHTLSVARGEEFILELSDGSKVWLNSESRITYPVYFQGNTREITLEKGEAYLEVAHDANKKFILTTHKSVINVLGTSFNVSAYDNENETITLVEGSVNLRHRYDPDLNSMVQLKPGDQAEVVSINHKIKIGKVNTVYYTAWKDGLFFFNYESMESIMKKLGRWYDVDIAYASEDVKTMVFFGKVKRYESIDKLLEMIKLTNKVDFSIKENTITIIKI